MSRASARRCTARGDALPTFRAHNEQAMAHAAIAYAKQMRRRRAMVCTTSIGPGATNMVTAAALAHVNRLPVLLLPGDVFASRGPDPVLQQVEDFADGTVSANDCFRPVSRYFDRITRPEQLLAALPRAMAMLTDPGDVRPGDAGLLPGRAGRGVRLSGELLRAPRLAHPPPAAPIRARSTTWPQRLRAAKAPLIVAGGGVLYAGAEAALAEFAAAHRRSRSPRPRPARARWPGTIRMALGAIGVTGTSAANAAAADGRPGHRRRHAAAGLHDRLARPVRQPGRASSRSTSRPSTRTSTAR